MTDLNHQINYWNKAARDKEFTHPVNLPLLHHYLTADARILDYGCGYGRICQVLAGDGFKNVTGVDPSPAMIKRGRQQFPGLKLEVFSPDGLNYPSGSFDAVLLVAVLTCIPSDIGQLSLMNLATNLLRPGGLVYISDYMLQSDNRNQARYQQGEAEFGTYGVFRLPEGAVVRHHSLSRVEELTAGYESLDLVFPDVVTMNGHPAKAFQFLGAKQGLL